MGVEAEDRDIELDEIDLDDIDDDLEELQQNEVIKEAIEKGIDLRQYARHIDSELRQVEKQSILDYVDESGQVVELHRQIQSCDTVLARMQEMLLGFEADLAGISDEMRHLQAQSTSMNIQLKNRREAEDKLKRFIDKVVLPTELMENIDKGPVNEEFVQHIVQLNEKLLYANQMGPCSEGSSLELIPSQTVGVKNMRPQLKRLKNRALARIREYLLNQINDLKRPKTNISLLQKYKFLPFQSFVSFLRTTSPGILSEVRDAYTDTMSKIVATLFRDYYAGLLKMHEETSFKSDLIAVEEQSIKGIFSTKVNLSKRSAAFSLGTRDQILHNVLDAPIITIMSDSSSKMKYPYEILFRSAHHHLMDSACNEYLFLVNFFRQGPQDMFINVFAKTLSLCLERLENYLFNCHDAIGLLIMIRINSAQRFLMQRRKILCLDHFFNRVALLLWPRFKMVFDNNVQSVRQAKVKRLGGIELQPHYVTRRYGDFAAAVLSLHGQILHHEDLDGENGERQAFQIESNSTDEMMLNDLAILRQEMSTLLNRMALQHKSAKFQLVFLINNYDCILQIFHERKIQSDDTTRFEELLAQKREQFVEEELLSTYRDLIVFVRHTERQFNDIANNSLAQENAPRIIDVHKAEKIVYEFAANWKMGIDQINSNVMKYFSNFKNGMEILKQVLTQLLLYYTRFSDLIKNKWEEQTPPSFAAELVTTHAILVEIKKYSRSF